VADWPVAPPVDAVAERSVEELLDLVRALRNARSEAGLDPSTWQRVDVTLPDDLSNAFEGLRPALERLARARPLALVPAGTELGGGGSLAVVAGRVGAAIRSDDVADGETAERDRARLDRELAEAERLLEAARARLADPKFVERAPGPVVDGARTRAAELDERVTRLRQHRAALG